MNSLMSGQAVKEMIIYLVKRNLETESLDDSAYETTLNVAAEEEYLCLP